MRTVYYSEREIQDLAKKRQAKLKYRGANNKYVSVVPKVGEVTTFVYRRTSSVDLTRFYTMI
jgi:hypothetical protein